MISTTLKTILIDGDLDDSSLLLDVHQSYRDKDLLTNHFDDMEDDSRDQVRMTFVFSCFCQQALLIHLQQSSSQMLYARITVRETETHTQTDRQRQNSFFFLVDVCEAKIFLFRHLVNENVCSPVCWWFTSYIDTNKWKLRCDFEGEMVTCVLHMLSIIKTNEQKDFVQFVIIIWSSIHRQIRWHEACLKHDKKNILLDSDSVVFLSFFSGRWDRNTCIIIRFSNCSHNDVFRCINPSMKAQAWIWNWLYFIRRLTEIECLLYKYVSSHSQEWQKRPRNKENEKREFR